MNHGKFNKYVSELEKKVNLGQITMRDALNRMAGRKEQMGARRRQRRLSGQTAAGRAGQYDAVVRHSSDRNRLYAWLFEGIGDADYVSCNRARK